MDGIPRTFSASTDRPFDPVSIRELSTQLFDRNNERLTDTEVQQMIENPKPPSNPNARIEHLTEEANKEAVRGNSAKMIHNMSLKEIASRLADTVHGVLDDLVNFNRADGIHGFLHIFIQSDRLVFVGIIIVLVTLAAMVLKAGDDVAK